MWLVLVVAAIALTSATYAWFVNNSKVTVDAADYTATAADYLLIANSTNPDNFQTNISFKTWEGKLNPVSTTTGTIAAASNPFFKVEEGASEAWKANASNVTSANKFVTATAGTDYFTDTFKLKSSTASQKVQVGFEIVGDTSKYTEQAIYVGFSGGNLVSPLIYQINTGDWTQGKKTGANTLITTTNDNITSSQGIAKVTDTTNNVLATGDLGVLTVGNAGASGTIADLAFDTLDATPDTAETYTVYIWLEGTDPQCYNDIANGKVSISINFNAVAA